MSIESAKAYIQRMKTDEEFRNRILNCKDKEERMLLVREEGFEFSRKEIAQVSNLLNGDILQQIAGGRAYPACTADWPCGKSDIPDISILF
ncbi:MAG: Nif11-like leader peptide family natural product precursor [Candidatus Nanoarchaeia archaeon]